MEYAARKPLSDMKRSTRTSSTADAQFSDERLEAIFRQYWEPLCRILYQILGDWDEAEDLALETMVQLHRRPPADERNLAGWLYRVATNLGLNALRSRKRRARYEGEVGRETLDIAAPADPASTAEHHLEQEWVQQALQSIRPRSAQILLLRYSGLSYKEIADALDLSAASVGTVLARSELEFERAFQKLRGQD